MNTSNTNQGRFNEQPGADGLTLDQFTRWFLEIQNQPQWRKSADREMEYFDGNQLDSEILQKMKSIGMPPAIEPLIGPAIEAVTGLEAKTRTDWKITADGIDGDEAAEGLNYEMNQAERNSGADKACTDAFLPQVCVGMGWVEVARESDPFLFEYRCDAVHRNEIFWDMLDRTPALKKARYLVRRRWIDVAQVKLKFPQHADLIDISANGNWTDAFELSVDGGTSTDLAMSYDQQRGWSIEEQEWRDIENARVCLFECWYRRWVQVTVIKTPDGRVVEYDKANQMHNEALAAGIIKPQNAIVSRMYVSFWMGPHKLHDGPTPYKHQDFPYVPFWGHKEDRTGVPYGRVRGMMYLQDAVNSAISKIRWGMSAIETTRTKGAVAMSDEQFRQMSARVDADFVLDANHMAQQGAKFERKRDFQLSEQQFKMLADARMGIDRASGITASFKGQSGNATSGIQESTQVEQANQSLASLMDNFKFARTRVGELLLSLIIEDMADKPKTVTIRGNALKPDRQVMLNQPSVDEQTGIKYLTNDVQRVRLKVALDDVPSTPSFREQQSVSLAEAFKSLPPEYQPVVLPHMLALMNVPNKKEILDGIQEVKDRPSPEMEKLKADNEFREKELMLKYSPDKLAAEISKLVSETVSNNVAASFAAMQAGEKIALVPGIAPVADVVLQNAGWRMPTPAGQDPNFPQAVDVQVPQSEQMPAQGDTSPMTPMNPSSPFDGANQGMDTMRQD